MKHALGVDRAKYIELLDSWVESASTEVQLGVDLEGSKSMPGSKSKRNGIGLSGEGTNVETPVLRKEAFLLFLGQHPFSYRFGFSLNASHFSI